MKDYYEILSISKEATMQEIKKAYFKMVRKFPPDKYQAEFKEIREAYEVLSDEGTRNEFDRMYSLSPIMRQNLSYAKNCMKDRNFAKAIAALNEILKFEPNTHFVKALLGEAYLENGNTGKAAKAFEELACEAPDNPVFLSKLADSYLKRGWQNKAIEAYERSVKIDKDNVSTWISLSDAYIKNFDMAKAYEALMDALTVTQDFDLRFLIYVRLIYISMEHQVYKKVIDFIEEMTEEIEGREDEKENLTAYIIDLAIEIANRGYFEYAKQAIDKAVEISPKDDDAIKAALKIDKMEKYGDTLWRAKMDKRIPKEIIQLLGFEIYNDEYDELDDQSKLKLREFNEGMVANEYGSSVKSGIKILKEKYPNLYELKKEFFLALENIGKRNKMIDRCMKLQKDIEKIINKIEIHDDDYDDDEFDEDDDYDDELDEHDDYDDELDEHDDFEFEHQEPIVRQAPKIGRNDPCPCGSGKKYKKCCGK